MKRTLLGVLATGLGLAIVPASAGPAGATAETEDGTYCRYVRGMSGAFYYQVLSNHYENIPVTEVHTAANVFAEYKYGQTVSFTLSGGLNASGGGWGLSASSGMTRSVTLSRSLPVFGGNTHKKIYAKWTYQKKRVVCTNKDPRSGQIVRRDYTPRQRYTPVAWTSELTTGAASTTVPRCNSDRATLGINKVRVLKGTGNKVNINLSRAYSVGMTLSGIGVSATASATSGSSSDFGFYTSSGTSYACGNASRIADSSRLYANAL